MRALRAEVGDDCVFKTCNGHRICAGAASGTAVCDAHPARLRPAILRRIHGHATRDAACPGPRVRIPVLRSGKGLGCKCVPAVLRATTL